MKVLTLALGIIALLMLLKYLAKDLRTVLRMIAVTATRSVAARIVFGVLSLWAIVDAVLSFRDGLIQSWWLGVILCVFSLGINILVIGVIAYAWGRLSLWYQRRRHPPRETKGI